MKRPTAKLVRRLVGAIADDIDAEFCGDKVCTFRVSEFVLKWNPSNATHERLVKGDD